MTGLIELAVTVGAVLGGLHLLSDWVEQRVATPSTPEVPASAPVVPGPPAPTP